MNAAAAHFMQKDEPVAKALPWLTDAAQLDKLKSAAWVKALRETGAEQFAQTGLPTNAWEGWQHTNVRALENIRFHYSADPMIFDAQKLPKKLLADSDRIVFVNGQYQPNLSMMPMGVMVMSLMEAVEKVEGLERHLVSVGDLKESPFKALNSAYMKDGAVIMVQKNTDIARPLEVLFYNIGTAEHPTAIHPRVLYWLGENAGLTVLERHVGEGVYLANSYTGIMQEPASRLKFYKLEEESRQAFHFAYTGLQQEKDSSFEGFSYAAGGRSSRQQYQNQLIDSAISCNIAGIYVLNGQQTHDFTVLTDHFEPNGQSVQNFKGVVDDQARSVFQGKIHVRRSAQKTNGNQLAHALLLSAQAEASFKPELEIYADDVKCSHGATTGQLDNTALFYLRSRGIPEKEARSLLVQSFLNETVERIAYAPVKELVQERVAAWLAR